jgi:hypothetical protein
MAMALDEDAPIQSLKRKRSGVRPSLTRQALKEKLFECEAAGGNRLRFFA